MLHSGPLSPRAVTETRLQYTRSRLGAPPNDLVGPARFANVARFASLGEAHDDGLTLSLRRRFSGAFSGRVAYTWSKADDGAGNAFFFTPQNSADIRGEWGPSDNDQRHRLVLSGSLESPPDSRGVARALRGLRLSGVFTCGSALPFNVLAAPRQRRPGRRPGRSRVTDRR